MPSDTHTDEELREPRKYYEDLLGIKYGNTTWESAQLEQLEAYLSERERAAYERGKYDGEYSMLDRVYRSHNITKLGMSRYAQSIKRRYLNAAKLGEE